jgi:signal transduction histidine kinase
MPADFQEALLRLSVQGILLFAADLRVRDQVSAACAALFGTDIRGSEVAGLLFADPAQAEDFRQGIGLVFAGRADPEVVFDLLEKEIESRGRRLRLDYAWLDVGQVLVTVTDITRERRFQYISRRDLERRFAVLKAVSHRRYFAGFTRDAGRLFDVLSRHETGLPGPAELEALARETHTFKGNAGFFDFPDTVAAAHALEGHLEELRVLGGDNRIKAAAIGLKRAYFAELRKITDILGSRWLAEADSISIPKEAYRLVEAWVRRQHPDDRRLAATLRAFREPFRELFIRFPEMAQSMAARLGKRLHPLMVEGGDFLVIPERYQNLMAVLVHLLGNALDHGIETPARREAAGKSPAGSLRIQLERDSARIRIAISDDGQGIDTAAVRAKACELGLDDGCGDESEAALMQVLFHQGFTTAAAASQTSGRGIGLAAVRAELDRLGGTIQVHSRSGRGTTFEITVPAKGAS